ncbi:hypothetical protein PV387_40790 [Streptomyces sp. ME02-6987-2C]|uniref:hypothetical protein n=1 Tax=unclassified Streptomyces TaxID=2593676 RepID=UPI0029B620DD|nr:MULTISPECIES: hypothetical protein [unclassified Streptomyces]MDX3372248.1 hypothetical protein [Streptomyces sp. ME02-6987-2C]MDX3427236.1 hypothetical protein [Streptomyces sp. ME02-6985-2c]
MTNDFDWFAKPWSASMIRAEWADSEQGNVSEKLLYTSTMKNNEAFCVRCGSSDVRVTHLDPAGVEGVCLRCDNKPFHGTPCQNCGGFRIDGSEGIPGMPYEKLPETVKCWDCGHRNPLRDPGPAPTGSRR